MYCLDALIADDTDADLSTGTPNDTAIVTAFAKHGITLLANASVDHTEMLGIEDAKPITIEADIIVDYPVYLGDVTMWWRESGVSTWADVVMTKGSGTTYEAAIPAHPEGTLLEYYFQIEDNYGNLAVTDPPNANATDPNLPYYGLVGFEVTWEEDFDNEYGSWLKDPDGTDGATTGEWEIESPRGTVSGSYYVQTDQDHTTAGFPSNFCAFTGQGSTGGAIGEEDVDDGKTTLRSHIFDLTGYDNPAITYYRWYTNSPPTGANPGADYWQVYISNDGTTWVPVEETKVSDNSWRRKAIIVKDYISLSSQVSLLFVASDSFRAGETLDGGSLIEAAVDDLFIWEMGETTPPSAIGDLTVNPGFEAFPNPASEQIRIRADKDWENATIELWNAIGDKVMEFEMNEKGEELIELEGLPSGIYFIHIRDENRRGTQKVNVNR